MFMNYEKIYDSIVKRGRTREIKPGAGTPMKIVCTVCKSYSSTFGHTKENCDKVLQKRLK